MCYAGDRSLHLLWAGQFLVKGGVGCCLLPGEMGRPPAFQVQTSFRGSGVPSVEVSAKAAALPEGEEASFPRPSNLSPWGQ